MSKYYYTQLLQEVVNQRITGQTAQDSARFRDAGAHIAHVLRQERIKQAQNPGVRVPGIERNLQGRSQEDPKVLGKVPVNPATGQGYKATPSHLKNLRNKIISHGLGIKGITGRRPHEKQFNIGPYGGTGDID